MHIKLHETKRVYVTAASGNNDDLCLIFYDDIGNQYKLDMSIKAML